MFHGAIQKIKWHIFKEHGVYKICILQLNGDVLTSATFFLRATAILCAS